MLISVNLDARTERPGKAERTVGKNRSQEKLRV